MTLGPAEALRGLKGKRLAWRAHCYESVASTNELAWEAVARGENEGAVFLAEHQTRGRGRHGRAWHSPAGKGLWFSILLKPRLPAERTPGLVALGAVAAAQACERAAGVPARIRWPNDIVMKGRKVAGLLVETREGTGSPQVYVVGIGLDVNLLAEDFPPELRTQASSLRLEAGHPIARGSLLRDLLQRFDDLYDRVLKGEFDCVRVPWKELSSVMNRLVRIREGGVAYEGRVVDVELFEGLHLELSAGGIRGFRGEHVELLEVLETP